MNKIKCPVCKNDECAKNGKRKGEQLYVCKLCGHQFRNKREASKTELWDSYTDGKQTIQELADTYGISPSTVKRRLRDVEIEWTQPMLSGGDSCIWIPLTGGIIWGVLLAQDEATGMPLYVGFIKHERVRDYADAVRSIEVRGYHIRGIVIDGIQSLFAELSAYKIQMCQFHMLQIVRRNLTKHPRLIAARELKKQMRTLTVRRGSAFVEEYQQWKDRWRGVLTKRTTLKSGKTQFTHRRLRSAMRSVDFYLPYLFTYQLPECKGMPNTNNKIEGTFADLKKNLNNHSGMSLENRKRFICGFFLALKSKLE